MWLVSLAQLLVLMAPASDPATAAVASGAGMPRPIATRQTLFSIPFQIDQPNDPRQQPVEVQLYVSANRGARWDLSARAEPSKRQFLFRAGGDGEYWFLIRTVDRTGQVRPQYNTNPGLIVVVDTNQPVLQLDAQRGEAGQVVARWQLTEPHLNLESFRIQYRTTSTQPWQSVAVDPTRLNAASAMQSGEVSWWPNIGTGRVEIRAEAADTAGNIAVTHAQVNYDSGPVAATGPAGSPGRPLLQGPSNAPPQPSPLPSTSWHSSPDAPAATATTGGIASPVNPPVRNQFVAAARPVAPPNPTAPANSFPGGNRPRMVNSRMFEINYRVNTPNPTTAAKVELWGTFDGGKTWSSFGTDDDGHSPMVVSVKQEGLYGFRIVLHGSPNARAPQPGEAPDFWIGVDLTKPVAQILAPEPGTANQMLIRWQAEDQMLAPQPVSLLFSNSPGGPWMPIATNLTNSGQHLWTLDSQLPPQFYLRLEVRDEAGNIGVAQTPQPVALNRSQPNVDLRDVRAVPDSARVQPKRYYFR